MAKTSKRQILTAEREKTALEMRRDAATYDEIGEALGVSPQAAFTIVKKALLAIAEQRKALGTSVLEMEFERIDMALRALAPQVKIGDHGAIDRWIRLVDLRLRYGGALEPDLEETNNHITVREVVVTLTTRGTDEPLPHNE